MSDAPEISRLRHRPSLRSRWAAGLALGLTSLLLAPAAHAAEGSIDHVEPGSGTFQVLFSVPGGEARGTPDLDSITVQLDGEELAAEGEFAADAGVTVRRTAVLAVDVSASMRKDGRFEEAKRAAGVFLENAPDDLYVAIVTFANDVVVAQTPSLDREASARVIAELSLSKQTRMYDGVIQAVATAGTVGSRSVLLLSDGRDTSDTGLDAAVTAIEQAKIKVDVVALAQSAKATSLIQQLSDAGNGSVISAEDPKALTQVFADEAEQLARQILITVEAPADAQVTEGTLSTAVDIDGVSFADSAFVTVATPGKAKPPKPTALVPVEPATLLVSRNMMLGGLAAAGVAVLVLVLVGIGAVRNSGSASVESRIAAYTRRGSRNQAKAQQSSAGVTAQAVGVAQKALGANKGFESALGQKLEAAGMAIKPAEWLLAHAAIAFLSGVLALLVSSGNVFVMLGGLALGVLGPHLFLSLKTSRRIKRFKSQLADTLQLMAGSLSAGLSLAQSVDTVVREGSDPISDEFRRALVETRLGVEIEEALESIGERMKSQDFSWVVMAIRIQREVGGNLSELLNNVAATIRERAYLERQVQALSAEGRLSVWILGGLPPGFMAYLMLANPEYLQPLITTTIGYVLMGVMAVLLTAGILWMKKLVKVEV